MYFIPLLAPIGGQERTLTDKANYLVSQGHDVMFVTYENNMPIVYPLDSRVRHKDLSCHFYSLYSYPLWRRFQEALKLKQKFRERMKAELDAFHPDVIVIAIPNTENFICDVMKLAGETPVIIESHLAQGRQVFDRGITEKWLYLFNDPMKAVRKSNLLVALTKGDAKCWHQQGVKNVKVIPNPVTYYPPQMTPVEDHRPHRIIAVGRLALQKRMDRLVKAFALIADKYPEWYIDIYGEGELHDEVQQLITQNGLDGQIHIQTPTSQIYKQYQSSQFFVLSSDFEGFGLVIVEAMACGIPVVVTNCPFGPSEIVDDSKTGLLAQMDEHDLAAKMEWMITHDAERNEMGAKAYEAAGRYRKEIIMKEWEQAYLSVVNIEKEQ